MRADLSSDLIAYQGVEYWVVKEPLGQKYYQFPPHVHYILSQLDGTKTIEELIDGFHREHAPKRISRSELQQLLTRFHKDGLVISGVPGQGIELLKRGRKNAAMEKMTSLSNILAVRWRGFDPERILNWLDRWIWWLFTPTAIVIALALGMVAPMLRVDSLCRISIPFARVRSIFRSKALVDVCRRPCRDQDVA